jgi:hypothetical protein
MILGKEELSLQLQNNGKKGMKLWKGLMCDLKRQTVVNPLSGYD